MKKIYLILILIFTLFNLKSQELSIQTGHSATINDLKFTPDNQLLISVGADNKIILWDMKTFMQMKILIGHTAAVNSVSICKTDKIFATASDDNTVKIWTYPEGKILKTYYFKNKVKAVEFSPDCNKIACASDSVYLIDIKTDEIYKFDVKARRYFNAIAFTSNNSHICFGGKGESYVYVYDLTYFNQIKKFFNRSNSLTISEDNSYIFSAGYTGVIKQRPIQKSSEEKFSFASNNTWDSYTDIIVKDNKLIVSNSDNLIYVFDLEEGDRLAILQNHEKEPKAIAITTDGKYLASAGKDRKINIWNLDKYTLTKTIEGGANSINSISFSEDGNFMFITYSDGSCKMWNLENKGLIISNPAPQQSFFDSYFEREYSSLNSFYNINPDKIFVINTVNKIDKISESVRYSIQTPVIWDIQDFGKNYFIENEERTDYCKFFLTDTNSLIKVDYDATHNQEYSALNNQKILDRQIVFETHVSVLSFAQRPKKPVINPEKLFEKSKFTIIGDVYYSTVSPNGNYILVLMNTISSFVCEIWDLESSEKISTYYPDKKPQTAGFSPYGNYFYTVTDDKITILETKSAKTVDSLFGMAPITISSSEEYCAYTDSENNLLLYNLKEQKQIFKIQTGHQTHLSDIKFNLPYQYIATSAFDGLIKFWNISDGKPLISLASFDVNDFIYVTPDNFYYSTKGSMKYIGFILNKNLYTFEQFDLKFNRPDTVLSRLAYTKPEEIEIYKKAYLKRIQKMGFNNAVLDNDINIPEVEIENLSELPISTDSDLVSIKINAIDSIYKLSRINIWVNNVPIYGSEGKRIDYLNVNKISESFDVLLCSGKNKIDVTVTNSQGIESLKKSFNIFCDREANPTLYIITVGISNYKDTSLNLNYAEKDATDISNLLGSNTKTFQNIVNIKLTNEQATKPNILALRDTLKQTKPDDQVILFFAGHGFLDYNYNYFLPLYDFEFQYFFKTVISYDDFVGLLDSIPARQKICFIDACHSGEIDTENNEIVDNQNNTNIQDTNNTNTNERSLWNRQTNDIPLKNQNTFEIMKTIFADLRRGSGTTIISSAGGQEYAFESDVIKNGIFSYTLIYGLKNKKADLNNDGKIMISELQDYVITEVTRLTKGKQNPTSRRENLDFDFVVWK